MTRFVLIASKIVCHVGFGRGSVISIAKEIDKITNRRRQEVSENLFKIGLKYKGYPRENSVKLFYQQLYSVDPVAHHSLLPAR